MLVFFPSYGVMDSCRKVRLNVVFLIISHFTTLSFKKFWETPHEAGHRAVIEVLSSYKDVVVEPKNKQEFPIVMSQYYDFVSGGWCLL